MALLLAVNGGVLHMVMDYYQRRAIPAADERSQQARAVLDSWDEKDEDWDKLSKRLRAAGYDLVVCRDGEIVSSGLDQGQQEFFARMLQSASWPEEGTLVVQDSGVVLVGRQVGDCLLVALPHPGHPDGPGGFGGHRPQAEVMLISVFVSGLAAMGVIWLFSVVFARYQLRQIMRPVNALTAGAKRVEQGDLSTPIDYQGRDEFAAVCAAFDHMQRHLLEEREKNAAYERARTDLVAGISHDLRTPLTSISGNASNLLSNGETLDTETRNKICTDIFDDAQWLIGLVENLLSITRIEDGRMNLQISPQLMDEMIEEALHHVNRKSCEHTITTQYGDEILLVNVDARLIMQVVVNLVDNAIKYTPVGSVIQISAYRKDHQVVVEVADNGPGIPDRAKAQVFEMFYTGQSRIADSHRSLGLGLPLCRAILTAHGGTLTLRDNIPNGSVFSFALPQSEVNIHE